ncbi:MAG TPA: hypothetical protein PLN21_03605 [Gemmatales bacterium]|nr:hypothetical protein [Gemmatales bacterium]
MKWYWHLLFLFVAGVAAWFASDWLSQPLWQIEEARPVSFDKFDEARKEWTTLTGDAERKNWWIETRAGCDPTVIRRLKLELPPLTGDIPYFGSSVSLMSFSGDAVLCHEYIRLGNPNANVSVEMRYCILDPVTGKVLRRFTIPNNPLGQIAGDHSRVAFTEGVFIRMFDINTKKERSIKVGNTQCLSFSPDGKLLACVDRGNDTFYLIDWENAVLIEPLQSAKKVSSFCFLTNDSLLLAHDSSRNEMVHSRWRWDGSSLKQVSPGVRLSSQQFMPLVKPNHTDELHLSVNSVKDWPMQLKSLFQWLADTKFPIERWIPKQYRRHWVVLDDQDHIQREYYESNQGRRHALYDQLSVEVEPDKQFGSATITFWNEHPVWPNSLAVGVVLYLLLYVMLLVRQSWSTQ